MSIVYDSNAEIVASEGKYKIIDMTTGQWHEDVDPKDRGGFLTYKAAWAYMNRPFSSRYNKIQKELRIYKKKEQTLLRKKELLQSQLFELESQLEDTVVEIMWREKELNDE